MAEVTLSVNRSIDGITTIKHPQSEQGIALNDREVRQLINILERMEDGDVRDS